MQTYQKHEIIQINAFCQTSCSKEFTSRQNWFTEGKKWEVRGSGSESLWIKHKLPPNKRCCCYCHLSRVRLCATPRRQPTRLSCPWDFPRKSTGVGCHCLLPYLCTSLLNNWLLASFGMPMTIHPYQATEKRKTPQEVLVRNKELTSSRQPGFCRGQQEVNKRWKTAVQRS